jgi:hypothetical protein
VNDERLEEIRRKFKKAYFKILERRRFFLEHGQTWFVTSWVPEAFQGVQLVQMIDSFPREFEKELEHIFSPEYREEELADLKENGYSEEDAAGVIPWDPAEAAEDFVTLFMLKIEDLENPKMFTSRTAAQIFAMQERAERLKPLLRANVDKENVRKHIRELQKQILELKEQLKQEN